MYSQVNKMVHLEELHIKNLKIRTLAMGTFLLDNLPSLKKASIWWEPLLERIHVLFWWVNWSYLQDMGSTLYFQKDHFFFTFVFVTKEQHCIITEPYFFFKRERNSPKSHTTHLWLILNYNCRCIQKHKIL